MKTPFDSVKVYVHGRVTRNVRQMNMNINPDHHDTYIEARDDTPKSMPAVLPKSKVSEMHFPQTTEQVSESEKKRRMILRCRGKLYDMTLAWRGIYLLGVGFLIAGAWFVIAWCQHGRPPYTYTFRESIRTSFGPELSPPNIQPPEWLLAIFGLITITSFVMMLVGTQDVNKQIELDKKRPNKSSDPT